MAEICCAAAYPMLQEKFQVFPDAAYAYNQEMDECNRPKVKTSRHIPHGKGNNTYPESASGHNSDAIDKQTGPTYGTKLVNHAFR
jgi:hypothetical protein